MRDSKERQRAVANAIVKPTTAPKASRGEMAPEPGNQGAGKNPLATVPVIERGDACVMAGPALSSFSTWQRTVLVIEVHEASQSEGRV